MSAWFSACFEQALKFRKPFKLYLLSLKRHRNWKRKTKADGVYYWRRTRLMAHGTKKAPSQNSCANNIDNIPYEVVRAWIAGLSAES